MRVRAKMIKMTPAESLCRRESCQPDGCDRGDDCWVIHGTADSLRTNDGGSPTCVACFGKIKMLPVFRIVTRYARGTRP